MKNVNVLNSIIIFVIIAVWGCNSKIEEAPKKEKFVLSDTMFKRIEISEVKLQQVYGIVKLNGKVTPSEDKVVEVFPLVGGNVVEVNVELGEYVEKGKVLAIIRSGEVADYERQLIDAQSDVIVSQKNLQVAEDLYKSQLNSEKDVFVARKEVEKAQADLRRVQEIYRIYGIERRSEYVVRSPISGFVLEKNITRDMQLRSDKSDNIFTIAQTDKVFIVANVYETDISKIKEGSTADIKIIAYNDQVFEGKIDRLFNVLDPETKTMKVRIKLDNQNYQLKPEMNATVTIHYDDGNLKMAAIPKEAVIFDKNKHFVMIYKAKDNIITREVEVYKSTDNISYIKVGLTEGDKIISKNQLFIYDAIND